MYCLLELLGLLSYLAQTSRVHPNFLTPIQMSNTDPPHINFDQVGLHHDASFKQPHGHQFEFSHTFHADMAPVTMPTSEPPRSYYYSESSMHELHSPTVTPSVSRSTSHSVSTPVSIRNLDDKLHKCALSHADKWNVELALDLIVLDAILNGTPWDLNNVEPPTLWNDNIRKLQDGKDSGNICNNIYYLHDVDPQTATREEPIYLPIQFSCNSIWNFGTQIPSLPFFTRKAFSETQPPSSCCLHQLPALACGLHRVWQPEDIASGKVVKVLGERSVHCLTLRYSADYNNLAQEIIGGMEKTLHYKCPDIRRAFEQLLHKIHEDGLKLKASRAMPGNSFFIPSTSDIISLQLNDSITQYSFFSLVYHNTGHAYARGDDLIIFDDANVADGAAANGELDPVSASEANEASPDVYTAV
ncbi:hypothetical protein HD554DRAFT_2042953 [Boletus coccyginus]|nr:hypothetical protein HD554DRAFT_2042953 [Boletus coccyginus]